MEISKLRRARRIYSLLASERQLVAPRNGFDDDILLLHTLLLELVHCPANQRVDDGSVPSSVDNEDSVFRAIVCLGWWRESLDGRVGHVDKL